MTSRILIFCIAIPVLAGSVVWLRSSHDVRTCATHGPSRCGTSSSPSTGVADGPISAAQNELLRLAFEAATKLPADPHIKTRSRAQEAVVTACLELDQPSRAIACVEKIGDWRRGEAYADVALHLARRGDAASADRYMDLARDVARSCKALPDAQDWHADRIFSKVAAACTVLGRTGEARALVAGIATSELAELQSVRAAFSDQTGLDQQVMEADALLATGDLDAIRAAIETYAQAFRRAYGDVEARNRMEANVKEAAKRIPLQLRVEFITELGSFAAENADSAKALELARDATVILDSAKWTASDRIPMVAKLAELRFRAGDRVTARQDLDGALALYSAERDRIVNIYRAGALRAIGEALVTLGDQDGALRAYTRAIEEGVTNPNSRPRAIDLSATCRSMALRGVDVPERLKARIQEICNGLGEPW